MSKVKIFKPDGRAWREKRDLALYEEYTRLMSVEGQGRVGVNEFLMQKFNIHSQGTIYAIIKRVKNMKQSNS